MSQDKGSYALLLALKDETRLNVGRLGLCLLPPGYYLYVGSAQAGLGRRLGRHLGGQKRLRWHIDYLLQHAEVVEVWYALSEERLECTWGQAARQLPQARIPTPGFGSSDCRCHSHLVFFPAPPSFSLFRDKLKEQGVQVKKRQRHAGFG
jgi:Uri superfamily endonuclease